MVSRGRARPLNDGIYFDDDKEEEDVHIDDENSRNSHAIKLGKVVDAATSVDMLRKDAKYLDRLVDAEYEAAKQSHGMWADPELREQNRDIVDEAEFRSSASFFQKMWRKYVRGG